MNINIKPETIKILNKAKGIMYQRLENPTYTNDYAIKTIALFYVQHAEQETKKCNIQTTNLKKV